MEFLIIRHAQSLNNVGLSPDLDSPLSATGCDQIKQTSKWLAENFPLRGFIGLVSPYLRCLQTACGISSACNVIFKAHAGVREWHGDKSHIQLQEGGMYLPKREKEFSDKIRWPRPHWNSDTVFFANEEIPELIERIKLFTESLDLNKRYIVVGHGASCQVLSDVLTGVESPKDHFWSCPQNASLTWIKDGELKWYSKVVYS